MPEKAIKNAAYYDDMIRAKLAAKHSGDYGKVTIAEPSAQGVVSQSAELCAASCRLLQAAQRKERDAAKVAVFDAWYALWVETGKDPDVLSVENNDIIIRGRNGV